MRPLRLSVEGFSCFRDRQELDFSQLDLFAISGPTGAGKSSLLDAMIFALYGKVPRVGKHYVECISLGRDRLSVTFDFRLASRRFRVTRVGKRRGAGQAQLEEILGTDTKPVADQVREVDRHVEALLGLGYEAFTQAVVLPQNEFAKFLKSEPRERRTILSSLLRLGIYQRMMVRANETAKTLDANVAAYRLRLEEDYAGATRGAVDAMAGQLAALTGENTLRKDELKQLEKELADLKDLHSKSVELRDQQRALEKLASEADRISAASQTLDAARRAATVLPLLNAADETERDAATLESEIKKQRFVLSGASTALSKAEEKYEAAREAAGEVVALNRRIRALDELKGTLSARSTAEKKLKKLETSVDELKAKRDNAAKAAREAKTSCANQVKEVGGLERALAQTGFDPAEAKKLDGWRDRANELLRDRADLAGLVTRAEDAEVRARKDGSHAVKLGKELAVLERQHKAAEADAAGLRDELKAAETEHAAMHLRQQLRVGEPCPVCTHSVEKRPPRARIPKVDAMRERLVREEDQINDMAERLRGLRRDATRAQATADASAERAKELRAESRHAAESVERRDIRMTEVLAQQLGGKASTPIEERVLESLKEQAALGEAHDDAEEKLAAANKKLATIERRVEKAEVALKAVEESAAEAGARVADLREETKLLTASIRKVTTHAEPLIEREDVAERVAALENERDATKASLQEAKRAETEADTALKTTLRQLDRVARSAKQKRAVASAAVAESSFESGEQARAAALETADERRLAGQVEKHGRDLHAVKTRIATLERDTAGRVVTDEAFNEFSRRVSEAREVQEGATRREATLKEQLKEIRRKVAAAVELAKRAEAEHLEQEHYAQLASDLRSDRFQDFMLREAFTDLVARASHRLFRLSGRYTLTIEEGEFFVLDRDNAGERRSAKTLSGGETFLASLALALELSEQVQRAAGAVALDSLFIDEGFGSLDPESLDIATDAIQSLPHGGRMVGVITHLADLTNRLDARVVVEKRAEGSRVRVETS